VKTIAEGGRSASAYRQARLDEDDDETESVSSATESVAEPEAPPRGGRFRADASPRPESRRARQKRLGRKVGRPRNPALELRFQPTDQDREVVKLLSGFALPLERICKAIRNPLTRRAIGVNTLQERFVDELEQGRAAVDQLLAGTLAKKLRDGNIVAAIWCSKNLWGWVDRVEQQGKSAVDLSVKIDSKDLPRLLEEAGLPPTIFGRDIPTIDEPVLIGNGRDRDVTHDNGIGE
jgi:hypothetical protein